MSESKTKLRLKKKLQKQRNETEEPTENQDLFSMLNDVNKILKKNPDIVKKVSKCVNDIMGNKELLETLTKQININPDDVQISSSSES
jgi:alkyl sulfatase BDS1-like metallo-beta-lactamase superfamily hydrolase